MENGNAYAQHGCSHPLPELFAVGYHSPAPGICITVHLYVSEVGIAYRGTYCREHVVARKQLPSVGAVVEFVIRAQHRLNLCRMQQLQAHRAEPLVTPDPRITVAP